MSRLVLRLFDYFCKHRALLWSLLVGSVLLLGLLIFHIQFKEDITDFLPFDQQDQQAMKIYQNLSGANKIVALIGGKDNNEKSPSADELVEAADEFNEQLVKAGVDQQLIQNQVDLDAVSGMAEQVYDNIPYFLTDKDYQRMDSLLSTPDYLKQQLTKDKQLLLLPSAGMLSENMGKDPFGLFTPVVQQLTQQRGQANYELYDGYIFTPDMKRAVTVITSPYGSSETEHNGALVARINKACDSVMAHHPSVDITLTGGPVIAMGNAKQIKTDSILSVAIAVVLIMLLLIVTFHSLRNILLIVVSIAWGWLFAMGALSLVDSHLSIIVIGISSVILGIAINYPLHLIAHLAHTPYLRKALKEIVMPLAVGNITTIGAFLTLVPLKSIALRDLGLFAAFLLLGTILFVMLFLPHLVKPAVRQQEGTPFLSRLSNLNMDRKRWLMALVVLLTIPLAWYSTQCRFDTNLTHINYMSDDQQSAMRTLAKMNHENAGVKTVYVVSSGRNMDEALAVNERTMGRVDSAHADGLCSSVRSCYPFLCSQVEQQWRLARWQTFVRQYRTRLEQAISQDAVAQGFDAQAFDDFIQILSNDYKPQSASHFEALRQGVFSNRIYFDDKAKTYNVIAELSVPEAKMSLLDHRLSEAKDGKSYHFEIGQLNSVMANNINNEFNYIGWACGLIVFLFLWFAMGNMELAALSFLPMAVSWIWILGIMGLLHIDFNIVNIILATFIFGQGDDYTIFMTEGCQYEYAYGRKLLAAYKNSILISALIMFIGMGTLIIARHPALHSLAEVTIVGMFSVVLMAYLLPPLIFRWVTTKGGELRRRPLTFKSILMPRRYPQECALGQAEASYVGYVLDVYYYCGTDIVRRVKRATADYAASIRQGDRIVVAGGNYGSVALMMALAHPDKTVVAQTIDDDDRAVTERMACRIAPNIVLESKKEDGKENGR